MKQIAPRTLYINCQIIWVNIKYGVIKEVVESIYVHKTFDFKVRSNLSINNKDIESISGEISSNKK